MKSALEQPAAQAALSQATDAEAMEHQKQLERKTNSSTDKGFVRALAALNKSPISSHIFTRRCVPRLVHMLAHRRTRFAFGCNGQVVFLGEICSKRFAAGPGDGRFRHSPIMSCRGSFICTISGCKGALGACNGQDGCIA
jgi:hypothetical protein